MASTVLRVDHPDAIRRVHLRLGSEPYAPDQSRDHAAFHDASPSRCRSAKHRTNLDLLFILAQRRRTEGTVGGHLALLKPQGVIAGWHDRQIVAGTEWADQIGEHLESARIILLLVSSSFLASDYCYGKEMERAPEPHNKGETRVIPTILRPCDWHGAPFAKLQALPKDAKA